jgi:tRNA pseudouridine(38-40) synthase
MLAAFRLIVRKKRFSSLLLEVNQSTRLVSAPVSLLLYSSTAVLMNNNTAPLVDVADTQSALLADSVEAKSTIILSPSTAPETTSSLTNHHKRKDEHVGDCKNDSENPEQGEQPNNQESNKKKNPRKNKRRKKEVTNDITWRQFDSINAGSYAHPTQQKLFHVQIPPYENSKSTTKRKMALLLGYLGTQYAGFQMNDGQRSLQAELELAMYRAGFIGTSNFGYPNKYSWSTSGRTDKGVHACGQVISTKLELTEQQSENDIRELINAYLPKDIRVLDVLRTTRSFCAKTQRDRVRYTYMFPSFMLMDRNQMRELFEKALDGQNPETLEDGLTEPALRLIHTHMHQFRLSESQLGRLRKILAYYQGTHSFHNFSRRVHGTEARAKRYIESFVAHDPILSRNDGTEWIPTQVVGQSFLLNQIRKMIGFAIELTRRNETDANDENSIESLFSHALNRAHTNTSVIPLAPAQGLYLDMSYYSGYSNHCERSTSEAPVVDWHVPGSPANDRWKDFREHVVTPHLMREENEEGNFVQYLFRQEYPKKHSGGKFNNVDDDPSNGAADELDVDDMEEIKG